MNLVFRASIDLGTNTCLLLIQAREGAGGWKTVFDRSTMVRLGQKVDQTGELQLEACERTLACLRTYRDELAKYGIPTDQVIAIGTATARDAKNGSTFFAQVESELGFRFRTLTGQEEAHASFLGGLLPGFAPESTIVFDIGGGSTEFQDHQGGVSLQMGSVRFTERYLKQIPVSDDDFWKCRDSVGEMLAAQKKPGGFFSQPERQSKKLIGVAGTVVALASLHLRLEKFDAAAIDGTVLTRGDLHVLVEGLKWRNREERLAMVGMEKGREDVLLAGALITWRVLEEFGYPELTVSTRGLRYGVFSL